MIFENKTTTNTMFARILLAVLLGFCLGAQAQDYPTKPIRIIVPNPPGGAPDVMARVIAEKLQAKWGQPVIVENRAGAAGNIGAEAVFRSPPDGYTFMFSVQVPLVINKSLYAKLSYDPDLFAPVSVVAAIPMVLVVHPKVAAENVAQLIALAKAHPDQLNYASGGNGSTPHLAAEMFKSKTGVKIVQVPYKGNSPALADLLGGQVDMMILDLGSALPYIRSGKLRALAVATDKRNPALPDVPALSESFPGLSLAPWMGMVAPPKTPTAIANKVSAAIAEAIKLPDVAKRLVELGGMQAIGDTPAEMGAFMREERERWGSLIRAIGATAD